MRTKSWTEQQLRKISAESTSVRQVIYKLGLKPAGGNYDQINKYLKIHKIDTKHFKGRGWSKGLKGIGKPIVPLKQILVKDSQFQSYKLKVRLFSSGLKKPKCELCGWKQQSIDGRIPVELDHVNGNSKDNRLKNLRILCPNCHSLQPTHRGLNMSKRKK
jgi:5-methylcytosine-specific restriction endonuclease McrA